MVFNLFYQEYQEREQRDNSCIYNSRGPEAAAEAAVEADLDEALSEGDGSDSENPCSFGLMGM